MFGHDWIQHAILAIPVFLLALTVHEYFHAWVALRFGDTTARDQGRLTLNPLAHLDFMGVLVFVLSQFRFGWAKPVPWNPLRVHGDVRAADFWISAAGPLSNLGLAVLFGLVYRFAYGTFSPVPHSLAAFLDYGVLINVFLALFNLIPLFPLDGSHILRAVMPAEFENTVIQIERVAPFLLLILVFTGLVGRVLSPPVYYLTNLIIG